MTGPDAVRLSADTLVTLDVDWVPDWMLENVAARLVSAGVKATFFATHRSPFLLELARDDRFEVGLHPNFLPGSTQGETERAVMLTLAEWYPGAKACRMHSLFQSEPLLGRLRSDYGMTIDASIHLPQVQGVAPHDIVFDEGQPPLVRVPHVFQDNMFALTGRPWTLEAAGLVGPGWKVVNFHPVHIVLNMASLSTYAALKAKGPLGSLTPDKIGAPTPGAPGAGALFDAIVANLSGRPTWTLSQRVAAWRAENRSQ